MVKGGGRVFAFGPGPGPKNVGLILDDGTKTVVTYRRYKEIMAEATYVSAEGFVQFNPTEREANGQKVVDVTIKTPGTEPALIRVTIWPELQGVEVERGDWIAVDGKFQVGAFKGRDGQDRQSIQISATNLAVVKPVERTDRAVVNKGSQDSQSKLF